MGKAPFQDDGIMESDIYEEKHYWQLSYDTEFNKYNNLYSRHDKEYI